MVKPQATPSHSSESDGASVHNFQRTTEKTGGLTASLPQFVRDRVGPVVSVARRTSENFESDSSRRPEGYVPALIHIGVFAAERPQVGFV